MLIEEIQLPIRGCKSLNPHGENPQPDAAPETPGKEYRKVRGKLGLPPRPWRHALRSKDFHGIAILQMQRQAMPHALLPSQVVAHVLEKPVQQTEEPIGVDLVWIECEAGFNARLLRRRQDGRMIDAVCPGMHEPCMASQYRLELSQRNLCDIAQGLEVEVIQ